MKNLSSKQASLYLDLISLEHLKENKYKNIDCFEYRGKIFKGNYVFAVEQFVKENPEGIDFYAWLLSNRIQLKMI